jgi:transcriptional regulator with XRE-family HTH domain
MQSIRSNWIDIMATDDKEFFVALGHRIAQLRKEREWTQQELADKLGIAQQTLAHYEVARIRVPASTLPLLATLFMTPIDDLVGHSLNARRAGKRGPASKLQQQIEAIAQLPVARQRFVSEMLDTVLAQAHG